MNNVIFSQISSSSADSMLVRLANQLSDTLSFYGADSAEISVKLDSANYKRVTVRYRGVSYIVYSAAPSNAFFSTYYDVTEHSYSLRDLKAAAERRPTVTITTAPARSAEERLAESVGDLVGAIFGSMSRPARTTTLTSRRPETAVILTAHGPRTARRVP